MPSKEEKAKIGHEAVEKVLKNLANKEEIKKFEEHFIDPRRGTVAGPVAGKSAYEIAKLCGVTVRTVQYYDTRGVLIPSELTEGGKSVTAQKTIPEKLKYRQLLQFTESGVNLLETNA